MDIVHKVFRTFYSEAVSEIAKIHFSLSDANWIIVLKIANSTSCDVVLTLNCSTKL